MAVHVKTLVNGRLRRWVTIVVGQKRYVLSDSVKEQVEHYALGNKDPKYHQFVMMELALDEAGAGTGKFENVLLLLVVSTLRSRKARTTL